jgi:hypothetical protein
VRTIPASVVLNELGPCPHGYAAVRPVEVRTGYSSFPVETITAAMHLRDLVMGVQLERCAPLEGRKFRDPSARSEGASTASSSASSSTAPSVRADAQVRRASHVVPAGTAGSGGSAAAGEGGADVDAVSTSATLE